MPYESDFNDQRSLLVDFTDPENPRAAAVVNTGGTIVRHIERLR